MIGSINLLNRNSNYSIQKTSTEKKECIESCKTNVQQDSVLSEKDKYKDKEITVCKVSFNGHEQKIYMGNDILASVGGVGGSVNVMYHEKSTKDDPIVHIWGIDGNGNEYREVVHLNDIDVKNASPAEMIALNGHLVAIGDKAALEAGPGALWLSITPENGPTSKMNFEQYLKDYIAMQHLGNNKLGAELYQYQLERLVFFSNHNNDRTSIMEKQDFSQMA